MYTMCDTDDDGFVGKLGDWSFLLGFLANVADDVRKVLYLNINFICVLPVLPLIYMFPRHWCLPPTPSYYWISSLK
jgi:hypothetical protein